jgi:hypothetical protein
VIDPHLLMASAASLPSLMAHTTSDCPLRQSPASASCASGPRKPMARKTMSASNTWLVPGICVYNHTYAHKRVLLTSYSHMYYLQVYVY